MTPDDRHPGLAPDGAVLVVAHAWYGDTIGGSFRLASEFAEDLAAAGHAVDYVCCAPADHADRPAEERRRGVAIHRYPPPPRAGPVARLRHHIAHARRLVGRLNAARRFSALSGHSPLQFLGAAKALRGSAAYLNYTVHSPFDDELASNVAADSRLQRIGRLPVVSAARWIDRRNCRLADRVQCDSRYTLRALCHKHGRGVREKGRVAPGWVDFDRFSSAGTRSAARQALGPDWQTDAPIFFTLRRLEARMGLDTLIEAAALVRDHGRDFRVLIGGRGALRNPLEQSVRDRRLADRVRFLGKLPEADLPACYTAADCGVLPTRALECFGLTVLESFAAGTPMIASSAAAIPEIAARQGPHWDFTPGDPQQLADRIEAFISGQLHTSADLRAIAREFDRPAQFAVWRGLLQRDPSQVAAATSTTPDLVPQPVD